MSVKEFRIASAPNFLAHRSSGLLMHPTSLPGPYGIGDLGPAARRFADALAEAKQTWWQMLPLTPPGGGDSPYQSHSAFAVNALLVSPDDLLAEGLVDRKDLPERQRDKRIDFARVRTAKLRLLERAWLKFRGGGVPKLRRGFDNFCIESAPWLDDYALFMAIRETQGGELWQRWPRELTRRRPEALAQAREQLADAIERESFTQFLLHRQVVALKRYANGRGVRLIGDLPIFVSDDSADVWTHPELFKLDRNFWPTVVAGVPPDIFSTRGQLWGNPHYHWRAMKRENYAWWIARLRTLLEQCDVARVDHFRGFAAAWEVAAGSKDARRGRWVKGPGGGGADLFAALRKNFRGLPLVAEDLGLITADVIRLRDEFGLPGMKVLQFAFIGDERNPHLPANYSANNVVYTGTHDNDTTVGWYKKLSPEVRRGVREYAVDAGKSPAHALMRLAWESGANIAIAPVQDLLELGTRARMNTPGVARGNWRWRVPADALRAGALRWLRELTERSGRC